MNGRTPQPIAFDSVADLYDIYVRADFDINFWLGQAKSVSGKVLELACGTGRVSIPLLEAGVELTCVDHSPGMLAQFRGKLSDRGLACPVYCQDIAQLNLPDRFDLIFIPFHSFAEIIDPKRQRRALEHIRSHLPEHGRFICTLHNPIVRMASLDGGMHQLGEYPLHGGGVLRVSSMMALDRSTHIASGEQVYEKFSQEKVCLERRILEINCFLFDKSEFEQLVDESGLVVEALYGDYDCNPFEEATSPFMIWQLKRSPTGGTDLPPIK